MSDTFEMHAKTLAGLETVLAEELAELGAAEVTVGNRLVAFRGDRRMLYRANLWLRTAIRVLKPIHRFEAEDERSLYQGVQAIDWAEHLDCGGSLAIDPVVFDSFCTHSLYAAQLTKDAIVDQFRARLGSRPSVELADPDLRINLHMNRNRVTIYLDSSGDSLHKRGYRDATNEAPINEVLAAGILRLTEWDRKSNLVDPMCGSGTFAIEAALWARNIAPGTLRPQFGFERWRDYDRSLHEALLREAYDAKTERLPFVVLGSDVDSRVVASARRNVRNAGLEQDVRIDTRAIEEWEPPDPPGVVVINPPYDERSKVDHIAELYATIGDVLKRRCAGYEAFVFTGAKEASKRIGLRAASRVRLFNGPIECRLLRFPLYSAAPDSTGPAWRGADDGQTRSTKPSSSAAANPKWIEQVEIFGNRLGKMTRHWSKWARRQGITCFRLYDRDIPEIPLVIDWYEGRLHIAEYDRPHDRTPEEHERWLRLMVESAGSLLEVEAKHVYFKQRRRQRGKSQYAKHARTEEFFDVGEGGSRFRVNLADYLDTGLFLDHRITRSEIEGAAEGKRFLNLFGYTGAFTVYAAAGGASSTTTVDLSNVYLDWAERNLRLNRLASGRHEFVRADTFDFLRAHANQRLPGFDLAVVDPPTFSNSKSTDRPFDIQRDHAELLDLLLHTMNPAGVVYFSTNCRKFRFAEDDVAGVAIREITSRTVPPDFRRKRPHRCWKLTLERSLGQ